jgi:hypothetical protein
MVRVVLVLGLGPRVCFSLARLSRRLNLVVWRERLDGGFLLIDE